jgi:hypothetical protein
MATFVNPSSGISQVASNVAQSYELKAYTQKEYNVIAQFNQTSVGLPSAADLAALQNALGFFQAMESGTDYPLPAGDSVTMGGQAQTTLSFSVYAGTGIGDEMFATVKAMLQSITINIQNPTQGGAYTLPVCFADSAADNANPLAPATLFDFVMNPNANYVAECEGSDLTNTNYSSDISDNTTTAGHHSDLASSGDDDSNVNGLNVHYHEHGCSDQTTLDVTGHAAAFEQCAQFTTNAETARDLNALLTITSNL